MQVKATELKNRLGRYLDAAQREPVVVEKYGREMAVVVSKQRYDELSTNEDMLWDIRARLAEEEGFLSQVDTERLFSL